MAQTTLLSQIDRTETYPKLISVSAPNNNFYLTLNTDSWTEQMLAELPCIRFDIYIEKSGTYLRYQTVSACLGAYDPKSNNTDALDFCQKFYDVPSSFYISITPIFDNNAIEAHNLLIENGIESGTLWTTPTDTFDIEITSITQGAAPVPPTPTADFTCDPEYFFDTEVSCTLDGKVRTKSNDLPAIGIVVYGLGYSYCNPIFISTDADAVKFMADGVELSAVAPTVTYDGLTWYYTVEENGVLGNYNDSSGNMKKYPQTCDWDNPNRTITQQSVLDILSYVNAAKA